MSSLAWPKARCCGESTSSQQCPALGDVPEQVLRLDVVVARVQVAVVLERDRIAAGAGMDAHAGLVHAEPVRERGVEHLHEDVTDVVASPLLEDVDQELPVAVGRDRAVGDLVTPAGRADDLPATPPAASASGSSSGVTRSTMGMSWTKVAPSSSRRKV